MKFDEDKTFIELRVVMIREVEENCVFIPRPVLVEPTPGIFSAFRLKVKLLCCVALFELRLHLLILFFEFANPIVVASGCNKGP